MKKKNLECPLRAEKACVGQQTRSCLLLWSWWPYFLLSGQKVIKSQNFPGSEKRSDELWSVQSDLAAGRPSSSLKTWGLLWKRRPSAGSLCLSFSGTWKFWKQPCSQQAEHTHTHTGSLKLFPLWTSFAILRSVAVGSREKPS